MAQLTARSTNASCCSAGATPVQAEGTEIRELVRERYAAAARASTEGAGCCSSVATADAQGAEVFGAALYGDTAAEAPGAALAASLGCGVPTAVAGLAAGETVLDLGSGAGADVLISARRVGPSGTAIGLDMTDEMLELARRHAAEAGVDNAAFVKGYMEDIPLPDASVDVIISNCVLNLAADKRVVLREAARVLRPGGRFAISDVIADEDMDDATRRDMQQWTGCIAGALTRAEFEAALLAAGLGEVEIHETHRSTRTQPRRSSALASRRLAGRGSGGSVASAIARVSHGPFTSVLSAARPSTASLYEARRHAWVTLPQGRNSTAELGSGYRQGARTTAGGYSEPSGATTRTGWPVTRAMMS